MLTTIVTVLLSALVVIEWWRGWRSARIAAVVFALVVMALAQPGPYRALRRAISLPSAQRDTTFGPGGRRLSEYESGAMTMYRVYLADAEIGATARAVALSTLVWLSVSPIFRDLWRRRAGRAGAHDSPAPGRPQASWPPEPSA